MAAAPPIEPLDRGGPPVTYLDHAASAPMRPDVAEAMAPFGSCSYGHPSASHRLGRRARAALEDARETVARHCGADAGEVVFTSGGTEADNLAILGVLGAVGGLQANRPAVVVSSAVEHAAVLEPCRAAAKRSPRTQGVEHVQAPVDRDGAVDLAHLGEVLDEDVVLVSIMLANNEVGTIQPLGEAAAMARDLSPRAVVHTDAVQAAGWIDLTASTTAADLISVSAHKLGGPKGTGALVVRAGVPLEPLVYGGGQERERRAGTHDVAGAVGLAAALELAARSRDETTERVRALRDRLADGILAAVPGAVESADRHRVLPGHCHLRFPQVEREELLVLLDEAGICASAGAACSSGALEPSHVLAAMGVRPGDARGAVRFSLGYTTTAIDVERALAVVPEAVSRLRG